MKKLFLTQVLFIVLFCEFWVSDSMAVGLGLYATWGSGESEWDCSSDNENVSDWDFDKDTEHDGFGFVFDTAVARDTVFNYRLSLGKESWDHEPGDYISTYELDAYVIENDFGFGIVRQPMGDLGSLRLWIGPELRISYSEGSPDTNKEWDVELFGINLGPVVGLNLNFGPVFTIGFKTGYLFGYFWGEGSQSGYYDEDYDVTESHYFLNLAIIFRINDTLTLAW